MNAERDPLIVWLEEIRDFAGATDRARAMAQQAIDRLEATPAPERRPTGDEKIDRLVEESKAETARGRDARAIKVPAVPGPTAVLCYATPPLDGTKGNPMVHCDRKHGHTGRHSWELGQ